MIHKFFYLALLSATVCSASIAIADIQERQAQKKFYFRADIGLSYLSEKINSRYAKKPRNAFLGSIGVGGVISSKFRTDVSVNYRGNYKYSATVYPKGYYESQKFSSIALMLSGYLNLKQFDKIAPYLTAGVGGSINKSGDYHVRSGIMYVLGDSKNNFAWQVGIGFLFTINNNISTDLLYKYVDLGIVTTKGVYKKLSKRLGNNTPYKGKLLSHELSLGINYKFN